MPESAVSKRANTSNEVLAKFLKVLKSNMICDRTLANVANQIARRTNFVLQMPSDYVWPFLLSHLNLMI